MTSKRTVRPFDGGWFAVHNGLFDLVMPTLSHTGWKVLCVAVRQTLGWRDPESDDPKDRKLWDHVSYSQFMAKTGISSKETFKRALDECLEQGYLLRRQPLDEKGDPQTVRGQPYYEYALNQAYELTIEDAGSTGTADVPNQSDAGVTGTADVPVTGTADVPVEPLTGTLDVHTKQSLKHTKQNGSAVFERCLSGLMELGFDETAAQYYAEKHEPRVILGWITYVQSAAGSSIHTPAGFVRSRLDAGAQPPEPEPSAWDGFDFGEEP